MLNSSKEILHENAEYSSLSLTELTRKFGDDPLNELAMKSELSWREVFVLKAYCAYIFQNQFPGVAYDQDNVKQTLIKRIAITKLIIRFFHSLFDPHTKENSAEIKNQIQNQISNIKNNVEIKPLEKVLELMDCTLRTNSYQKDRSGRSKDYLCLKIDTTRVKNAPRPLPYLATFVFATSMGGCILRGGKVSRGGMRWSDREDFRMEILALMRAQKLKNTIVVPDGAKGGFILKNQKAGQTKEERAQAGIAAYKILLKGFLDITDNLVDGKVVKPTDVVCRDVDDTYLVVAADKGTGNFSDIANEIAKEYNFWLDDAFASGGSVGYNHKKLAITSCSTWVSVVEHFNSIGIDPQKDVFTVTAIGSMAGDVCGNGLLLSKKMKVLAAFSSRWIFVDPSPDTEISFKERERLFNLPGANWIDYNSELISKGGGVFPRSDDAVPLSKEMKELFNLEVDKIMPANLIKQILMLKVDLLWSGAVGTYVKTKAETHTEAMDKANDMLRVDAEDLRCKVVAEGANLTFTQEARVKYALEVGLMNTDFIDNSGGVDFSDHEVNIKIALNNAVSTNKITQAERNNLLEQMQDDVVSAVIMSSKNQNHSLSLAAEEGALSLKPYLKLISILKEKTDLDCQFERLPDEKELERRVQLKLGLVRPELSILLSYSKRAAYESLLQSDDTFASMLCEALLFEYFPQKMRETFKDEILAHPLKKEICITKLANDIIDHAGLYFFHQTSDTGTNAADIAKAYLTVWKNSGAEMSWIEAAKQSDYKARLVSFFAVRKKLCDEIIHMLQCIVAC